MALQHDRLFGQTEGGGVPTNTLDGLFRAAQNNNAEAVSVLLQYTSHQSRDTRDFAKSSIAELYGKAPRLVGEMAGELVKVYGAQQKTNSASDIFRQDSMAFVSMLSAQYENRNGNTGQSPYGQAKDVLRQFVSQHSLDFESSDVDRLLASSSLVDLRELNSHTQLLSNQPVEHMGAHKLDTASKTDAGKAWRGFVNDLRGQIAQSDGRTRVAAVLDQDHFVSVVLSDKMIAILDTRPKPNGEPLGTTLREHLAEALPEADVIELNQELQEFEEGRRQGFPNGCAVLNVALHQWLSDEVARSPEGENRHPIELVLHFSDHTQNLSDAEKQELNDVTRLKLFSDYAADAFARGGTGVPSPYC